MLTTPNVPTRYISYNMGTKRAEKVSQDHYKNLGRNLGEYHCEKVMIDMRDGT